MTRVSVVVAVLNDADALRELLLRLRLFIADDTDIIVVDGGSEDDTIATAEAQMTHVVRRSGGRGAQLALGTRLARGDYVWLLHADAAPSVQNWQALRTAINGGARWGRFDVALDDSRRLFRAIEKLMNWRSAATSICTGDQGMFVCREVLSLVGGVPEQPLMEDIELSKRLRRLARCKRIEQPLCVSARRWRAHGIARTIVFMWRLRLRYFFGADPDELAAAYYDRSIPDHPDDHRVDHSIDHRVDDDA